MGLVPMTSFFESSLFGQKYAGHMLEFKSRDELLFAAGVYSFWSDKDTGEEVLSFSVVTTKPPKQVYEAGHDRCPVFLTATQAKSYLNSKELFTRETKKLLTEEITPPTFEIAIERPLKAGWEKRA